jgi:plastocyanin
MESMRIGQSPLRRGLLAGAATLAVGGVIAGVGVAGAAQDTTIYVSDKTTTCFTATPDVQSCGAGGPVDLTIETGDKVTWDFAGATNYHNVAAAATNPSDPPDAGWDGFKSAAYHSPGAGGTDTFVFGKPGVYRYVCQLHSNMFGTITVEGDEVETPTPTATETPDATPEKTPEKTPVAIATTSPTPAPTGTPDNHTSTPAPGHASVKDTEAPRLQSATVKRVRAGAQVRFWLSEPATVSIGLVRKGAKSTAASAVVQAPAGTRSFVLRAKALKKGTYTVTLKPVDAMGNKGTAASRSLKVK